MNTAPDSEAASVVVALVTEAGMRGEREEVNRGGEGVLEAAERGENRGDVAASVCVCEEASAMRGLVVVKSGENRESGDEKGPAAIGKNWRASISAKCKRKKEWKSKTGLAVVIYCEETRIQP